MSLAHEGSSPEWVRLVAYRCSALVPDDDEIMIFLDVDGGLSLTISEGKPGPHGSPELETTSYVIYAQRFDETRDAFAGVESVTLRSGVLALTFSAESAAALGFSSQFVEITLDVDPSDIEALRGPLEIVFGSGPAEFRPRRIDLSG